MLVLSRGRETAICIGSDITIRVLEIRKGQVKLGIEAPSGLAIWREELAPIADRGQPGFEQRFCRSHHHVR
jgi:carbon storage regulator